MGLRGVPGLAGFAIVLVVCAKLASLLHHRPRETVEGDTMAESSDHVGKLAADLADKKISRREFVRFAALLGMAAPAAYAMAGEITGEPFAPPARADEPCPRAAPGASARASRTSRARTPIPGAATTPTCPVRSSNT